MSQQKPDRRYAKYYVNTSTARSIMYSYLAMSPELYTLDICQALQLNRRSAVCVHVLSADDSKAAGVIREVGLVVMSRAEFMRMRDDIHCRETWSLSVWGKGGVYSRIALCRRP